MQRKCDELDILQPEPSDPEQIRQRKDQERVFGKPRLKFSVDPITDPSQYRSAISRKGSSNKRARGDSPHCYEGPTSPSGRGARLSRINRKAPKKP
jgi:hypothetical protein